MFLKVFTSILCAQAAWAYSSPPSGAITVGSSGTYSTFSEALSDTSSSVYFIYSGTYTGQTLISRSNIKIYGQTSTADSYTGNTVTLTNSLGADDAGSNDASGTVRVHGSNVALYNLNIVNSRGEVCSCDQAIALSIQATQFGGYGLKIVGYQDTLLANVGYEFIANSYIEGNTDFIFGQTASLWITSSVIHTLGDGWITASGRSSSDSNWYVIDSSEISGTGDAYLGRPWQSYARVVFQNSYLHSNVPAAGWSVWSTGDERTDHVTFAEYGNSGAGASTSSRASFSEVLSSAVTISTVLGSTSWIDSDFL
ncbi:pectin lyase-like protein [Guyanagaster necrorhizus]|uniref:pectinesterase n=1 Tax=Guyanagaster necrorhizus TaxID=856835 RepID=A0A9P8ALI5_9AGAR|nr:pectin lyase-like protein [Guyanagaster necrorhizus MCA 3950]KAG7439835.1 pectin lyase-like protein [Guyanagaster necrorhizus MCA 3950]